MLRAEDLRIPPFSSISCINTARSNIIVCPSGCECRIGRATSTEFEQPEVNVHAIENENKKYKRIRHAVKKSHHRKKKLIKNSAKKRNYRLVIDALGSEANDAYSISGQYNGDQVYENDLDKIDDIAMKCVRYCRQENIPVRKSAVCKLAERTALDLGVPGFVASIAWYRYIKRQLEQEEQSVSEVVPCLVGANSDRSSSILLQDQMETTTIFDEDNCVEIEIDGSSSSTALRELTFFESVHSGANELTRSSQNSCTESNPSQLEYLFERIIYEELTSDKPKGHRPNADFKILPFGLFGQLAQDGSSVGPQSLENFPKCSIIVPRKNRRPWLKDPMCDYPQSVGGIVRSTNQGFRHNSSEFHQFQHLIVKEKLNSLAAETCPNGSQELACQTFQAGHDVFRQPQNSLPPRSSVSEIWKMLTTVTIPKLSFEHFLVGRDQPSSPFGPCHPNLHHGYVIPNQARPNFGNGGQQYQKSPEVPYDQRFLTSSQGLGEWVANGYEPSLSS